MQPFPKTVSAVARPKHLSLFLREPAIQKLIMEKNYMRPVVSGVENGTEFTKLPEFKEYQWHNWMALVQRREELLRRWRELEL